MELTWKNAVNATKGVINWYELGIELDFDESDLDVIKANHPDDVMGAKNKCIGKWLDRDPHKSWDKLASALRKIGRINLSDKISEYGPGMLSTIVLA